MIDSQDLARRYLALWKEYLPTLLTDPATASLLWDWALGRPQTDEGGRDPGSAPGAAPTDGAPDRCVRSVAEFARRLTAFEDRLAILERDGPAHACLAGEIDALGFEPVAAALDAEIARRATAFIDGLEAYRKHPYRRSTPTPPRL